MLLPLSRIHIGCIQLDRILFREDLKYMMEIGAVEPAHSEWRSPTVSKMVWHTFAVIIIKCQCFHNPQAGRLH